MYRVLYNTRMHEYICKNVRCLTLVLESVSSAEAISWTGSRSQRRRRRRARQRSRTPSAYASNPPGKCLGCLLQLMTCICCVHVV